ncbi:3-oxoacyl-[acyl-carrier protein] reductase [Lihuaxuella thermophila]|uniref:3-oxoacyl-[acyl-carrier protein] reductase n=2 Tax=Lihuaxuella thermophila TaxID=1173111 RepID=A0A1H8HKN5_9BACL|nr:3-oxoacyl-[acyl-carrier protein] reductase [Lihuaxuella thermophila]
MAAIYLAEQKWNVALNGRRSDESVEQLVTRLRQYGGEAHFFAGDVSCREQAVRVVRNVTEQLGRIDLLVHAVGPFIRERKWFVDHSPEEIEQMISGNLLSAMWMAHAVLPKMREQKWGRIIFFGFGRAGEAPAWPDRSVYAAAKTGLVSFTKTLAVEEAPYGITVNMICPGDIVGEKKEMRRSEVAGLEDPETPRGRPGSGEDVARVIHFLAADASDFVTGNMIHVTGGLDVIHPVSKKHARSPL